MNEYDSNSFYLYHSLNWLLENYSNGSPILDQNDPLIELINKKMITETNCLLALHWFELHHAQIVNYTDVLKKSIIEIVNESIKLGKVSGKEYSAFMIRRTLEIDRLENQNGT